MCVCWGYFLFIFLYLYYKGCLFCNAIENGFITRSNNFSLLKFYEESQGAISFIIRAYYNDTVGLVFACIQK